MTKRILIIDSGTATAEILWTELKRAGYEPMLALSRARAIHLIQQDPPDAILLRGKLPDVSWSSLIFEIRARAETSRLPVIVIGETGGTEEECIRALEEGADDYISYPYGIREMLARIQVVLRPMLRETISRGVTVDALTIDFDSRRVFARMTPDSTPVELSIGGTCYRLLRLFAENPYQMLSREVIIRDVWRGSHIKDGTVDVFIKMLRDALLPLHKRLQIETVRGHGFRLAATADAAASQVQKRNADPAPQRHKRTRADKPGRPPLWAPDLRAAIEKIRDLEAQIQKRSEENQALRNEIRARKNHGSATAESIDIGHI